jgi:predicted ATP-binding protein involved in virulence
MAKTTKNVVEKKGRSKKDDREVPSAYFLSFEVENVLCFKDVQRINLADKHGNPAQWTVILGDNGVGKTTLLRCLAGMEVERDLLDTEYEEGEEEVAFPGLFIESQIVSNWSDFKTLETNVAMVKGAFLIGGSMNSQFEDFCGESWDVEVDIGSSCSVLPWHEFQGLLCYGYGATRYMGEISLSENIQSPNSASLFSEGKLLINAEEWLLQTDYAHRTASGKVRQRLQAQVEHIKNILKHILPDVEDISITSASEDRLQPRVEFLTPYGWVHIDSLGLGYRSTIAWMVDLAVRLFRRYPNSLDPLAEPAIVLVDEIDLHLHPRWQRTIMDFLTDRFPNTQFIVTAHSPLVVQAAQNANIVLLRREGDRVVIDNNPDIIENWRVDQVLTSVFGLPTARAADLDDLSLRREALLDKAKLSKKEQTELDEITAQLGDLPTAESPQEIKAMNIIRRAAKYLESK